MTASASAMDEHGCDAVVRGLDAAIDQVAATDVLEHPACIIPDDWFAPAAKGESEQCVAAIRSQFELGRDGAIFHGAGPTDRRSIVDEYRTPSVERLRRSTRQPGGARR